MAEKMAKDPRTGRCPMYDTIDYYIDKAGYNNHIQEMLKLRDMVHGIIYEGDYSKYTNPFNYKTGVNGKTPQFNATLRNHNILKGIVNLLLGEFGRRSHEYTVVESNPDKESVYLDKLTEALKGYYQQEVVNKMNEQGFPTGYPSQELPPLEQYKENFTKSYKEQLVFTGQEALDYIKFNQDIDSKILDAYWEWVVYGRWYSFKGILHDDVIYEQVSALEMYTPYETHSRFVEDRSFAVRKRQVSAAVFVDMFRGDIEDELLDKIDSDYFGTNLSSPQFTIPTGYNGGLYKAPTVHYGDSVSPLYGAGTIDLYHVQFKTWVKVGILEYEDPLGQIRTIEVDETYKLDKALGDIRIKWEWINQVMEAYKANEYYLNVREVVENRAELNNSSVQKLGYNGIEERAPGNGIQSIIKEGVEFQEIINIQHYQVEKICQKNKDKLLVMPFGMIPRKQGLTEKDVMYHADATSILWVDETSPSASYGSQMIKSIDMSLGQYIGEQLEFIKYVKQEYWDTIGMNPQRYADVGQNAGKGTTEAAIVRSAIITAELTRQFDKCLEKDYAGLVDISKLAWVNGKKGNYIKSDGTEAILTLNADDVIYHTNSSYGVFVKDAFENTEARDAIRALAQPLVQNGASVSGVAKLWSTNNTTKLIKIVEQAEALNQKYQQQIQEAEAQNSQALQQMINDNAEKEREVKRYVADTQLEGTMYTADKRAEDNNSREEPRPANEVEIALAQHKILDDNKKAEQKDRDLDIKAKAQKEKNNNPK